MENRTEPTYSLTVLNRLVKDAEFEKKKQAAMGELERLLFELKNVESVLTAFHARKETKAAVARVTRSLRGILTRMEERA